MDKATEKSLEKLLKLHARGLGIPDGSAELFITKTLAAVKKSLKGKSVITAADLKRLVAKELKKYNRDFAYVYEKYDTII